MLIEVKAGNVLRDLISPWIVSLFFLSSRGPHFWVASVVAAWKQVGTSQLSAYGSPLLVLKALLESTIFANFDREHVEAAITFPVVVLVGEHEALFA